MHSLSHFLIFIHLSVCACFAPNRMRASTRPRIQFRCHTLSQPFQCEKLPLVAAHAHLTPTSLIAFKQTFTSYVDNRAIAQKALPIGAYSFLSQPLPICTSREKATILITHTDLIRSRIVHHSNTCSGRRVKRPTVHIFDNAGGLGRRIRTRNDNQSRVRWSRWWRRRSVVDLG